jgi:hypothetical protein
MNPRGKGLLSIYSKFLENLVKTKIFQGRSKVMIFILILIITLFISTDALAMDVIDSSNRDRISLSATIYNTDIALIKETRQLRLAEERGRLIFKDVPSMIVPESITVSGLKVLQQSYNPSLLNKKALLDAYTGKKVKLVVWDKEKLKKRVTEAILLRTMDGYIFDIDGEIYLDHPGSIVVSGIPEDLHREPYIEWLYEGPSQNIEVSYLTRGIGWQADYVMILGKNSRLRINAWASIKNQSGISLKNVRIMLVAGSPHMERERPHVYEYLAKAKKQSATVTERPLFEYHLYDFRFRTDLAQGQTKQLNLFSAEDVAAEIEYILSSSNFNVFGPFSGKSTLRVKTYILFKNVKENNLGKPLPAGTVRMYKEETNGAMIFIGEARLPHTPSGEKVRLLTGYAFDIVAERIQKDYKKVGSNQFESEWEIILRNHKQKEVVVAVEEKIQGDWRIIESNYPYKRTDVSTLRFNVRIKPKSEERVRYRIWVRP